jgi:hypothetical protein
MNGNKQKEIMHILKTVKEHNYFQFKQQYCKQNDGLAMGDISGHIQVGQNNGNTTDTVHISLLIWCWTTFCRQYSCNPFMKWTHTSFKQSLV